MFKYENEVVESTERADPRLMRQERSVLSRGSLTMDLPLTVALLTSKSIGVIDSLGCISVSSLMSVKERVLKISKWSVYSNVQFDH
jgi:hypothetical protein